MQFLSLRLASSVAWGSLRIESNVTGSSVRRSDSLIAVIGTTDSAMGGSVYARIKDRTEAKVPDTDFDAALSSYRSYHLAVSEGLILAAHDVSEGGLGGVRGGDGFFNDSRDGNRSRLIAG